MERGKGTERGEEEEERKEEGERDKEPMMTKFDRSNFRPPAQT